MSEGKPQDHGVNRRSLFRRGAAITGGGMLAAGMLPQRTLALDSVEESLLSKVLDRGHIVVGTGSTNPPWHFEDDNGDLVGFDIEMARILSRGLFQGDPDKVEFLIHEADARIPDLLADKVDINFQFMSVFPGRALQVEYTIPYYREGVTLIMLKDSPYNNLADFEGKNARIAILMNVTAEDMVHRGVPDAEVQQLESVQASLEALKSGRVDATAIDMSTAQWYAQREPDTYKFTPEGWDSQSYAGAVKPGDQIWLNFVNTVMQEALLGFDFALYREAFEKYFGEAPPDPVLGFPIEYR